MSAPTIGVVITAFNSSETIEAAIESVLAQTRLPDRIIVVDNSTDDEGARLANAALEGSTVQWEVLRVANTGPGNARNHGWRAVRTDWIQFLDADDVISPAKLAVQAPIAERAAADVAVVHSPWQHQRKRNGEWAPEPLVRFAPGTGNLLVDVLHRDDFIPAAAALIRTRWLDTVAGFDERHWLLEDIDLYLRMAMAGARVKPLAHAHPLFFYRLRDNSLYRSSPTGFARAMVRNAELVEQHFGDARMPADVSQLVAAMYWSAAYRLAAQRDDFVDLIGRIERLAPPRNPVDHRTMRMLLAIVGARATSRIVGLYRGVRGGAEVSDPQ